MLGEEFFRHGVDLQAMHRDEGPNGRVQFTAVRKDFRKILAELQLLRLRADRLRRRGARLCGCH